MKESDFWKKIKGKWSGIARMMRVENAAGVGTPDLYLVSGGRSAWVELKQLRKGWPAREATPVTISHFVPEQRLWMKEWGPMGIPCWILVEVVGEGIYLFDYLAADYLGMVNRKKFESSAVYIINKDRGSWIELLRIVLGFKV